MDVDKEIVSVQITLIFINVNFANDDAANVEGLM